MSEVKVNKISPRSGTTVTLGDSGDTITIPSGGDLTVDTDTLHVDSTNNRVGIRTTTPANTLEVVGGFNLSGNAFLGGGIYLNGDTAAANKLDDYEEGDWTPAVAGGSISGTSITYVGKYVKIGDTVFLYFNASSASDDVVVSSYVQFSGLPFTLTYGGTSTVVTEDPDVFARQGFATLSATRLTLSACGSNPGTTSIKIGIMGFTF